MESKEYAINYLDMHPDNITPDFIIKYIALYMKDNNLFEYIDKIILTNVCSYNQATKILKVNPDFANNIEFGKIMRKSTKNKLKNLMLTFMLNHELTHVLQAKNEKENNYIDEYFKGEFIKSEEAAELDINNLDSKYYKKYHDIFLFESHADMNAIIEVNNLLKELNDTYPKELYNMYISKLITKLYKNNLYPIKLSNRMHNKIVTDLKNINPHQFESLKREKIVLDEVPEYSIQDLIIHGYPIPTEAYKHFEDISQEKKKAKSLF